MNLKIPLLLAALLLIFLVGKGITGYVAEQGCTRATPCVADPSEISEFSIMQQLSFLLAVLISATIVIAILAIAERKNS